MKQHLKLAVLAVLTCIFVFVAALTCRAQVQKPERVYCIAQGYQRISPTEWVGYSNCGTVWKVVASLASGQDPDSTFAARGAGHSLGHASGKAAEAWYYDEADGVWSQLEHVPAVGDTLGYIDKEK